LGVVTLAQPFSSPARLSLSSRQYPQKTSASSATSAVLILRVVSACDDFCPKIQSPAFVFPCPHLSDGEISSKYRHSALDETARSRRSESAPFIFWFSPCLRASVVQRSCLWLRLRRAAFQGFDPGFGCGSVAVWLSFSPARIETAPSK